MSVAVASSASKATGSAVNSASSGGVRMRRIRPVATAPSRSDAGAPSSSTSSKVSCAGAPAVRRRASREAVIVRAPARGGPRSRALVRWCSPASAAGRLEARSCHARMAGSVARFRLSCFTLQRAIESPLAHIRHFADNRQPALVSAASCHALRSPRQSALLHKPRARTRRFGAGAATSPGPPVPATTRYGYVGVDRHATDFKIFLMMPPFTVARHDGRDIPPLRVVVRASSTAQASPLASTTSSFRRSVSLAAAAAPRGPLGGLRS